MTGSGQGSGKQPDNDGVAKGTASAIQPADRNMEESVHCTTDFHVTMQVSKNQIKTRAVADRSSLRGA